MSSGTAARGRIDWVNRKVYNTPHQMTARTDRSELGRYSPAYATGVKRIIVRLFGLFDCQNRSDQDCHGKRMNAVRQRLRRVGRTGWQMIFEKYCNMSPATGARTRSALSVSLGLCCLCLTI